MDVQLFYERVGNRLGPGGGVQTRAAEVVLMALHLRMREEAARRLEAQLPRELVPLWRHGGEALKERRDAVSDFTRGQFIKYVGDRLEVARPRAEETIHAVFAALREQLPEADAIVRDAVPEDIRDLWLGQGATAGAARAP